MKYVKTMVLGVMVGAMVAGTSTIAGAATSTDDFEGYSTGAWTPAGPPTAGSEGWTVDALGGSPSFAIAAGDGFGGSQGFQVNASGSGANKGGANWHVSEDINTLPQQTIHAEWQGVLRNNDSFGRLIFNSSNLNFVEMRSDSAFVYLRYDSDPGAGKAAADAVLPTDVVGFSWPSNTVVTPWYAVEIESDYDLSMIRARFGTREGDGSFQWNSFSPWLDMWDTVQPTQISSQVEGRIHFDNLSLTATGGAIPEPATLGLFGMAGLGLVMRRAKR